MSTALLVLHLVSLGFKRPPSHCVLTCSLILACVAPMFFPTTRDTMKKGLLFLGPYLISLVSLSSIKQYECSELQHMNVLGRRAGHLILFRTRNLKCKNVQLAHCQIQNSIKSVGGSRHGEHQINSNHWILGQECSNICHTVVELTL